jgi:CRISPR-associated protein Cas2
MLVIVSYDVDTTDAAGRRRRIAKTCQDNAARTVLGFQCEVPPADWVKLRTRVIEQVYRAKDSLSF